MAKKNRKGPGRFFLGMVIYAVVFLTLMVGGLYVFWDFMESYEASRPKNTMDAYIAQLTAGEMVKNADDFLAELDGSLHSREDVTQIVSESLTDKLSYAKKSSESTENRQVYVLRCGSRVIGQVDILAGEPDRYGSRIWRVNQSQFRFPHLVGDPVSLTVPEGFSVCFNGHVLDDGYITGKNIPYPVFADFAGEYEMPTMVTYTVDRYLGQHEFSVTDPSGAEVALAEEMDWGSIAMGCTEEETEKLQELTKKFLDRYTVFFSTKNNIDRNYANLIRLIVPNGDLAQRMGKAIDGLQFAQSGGDDIVSVVFNQCLRISDERYFCDVSYVLRTIGKKGVVETTNNMRLICLENENDLKVEAIVNY